MGTVNDVGKASTDTENKDLDASLSEPKLKKTFNDVEIPLKKVSKGPKTLRQSTDILNAIKATLKGTDVSFSEKKDNIKELNKMTVKKKLINEKKRVNVKETTARNKETLKNEGDALNKIDETQKVSNVLNQTQKDILDKMLIHVKQASIGKKKRMMTKTMAKKNTILVIVDMVIVLLSTMDMPTALQELLPPRILTIHILIVGGNHQ